MIEETPRLWRRFRRRSAWLLVTLLLSSSVILLYTSFSTKTVPSNLPFRSVKPSVTSDVLPLPKEFLSPSHTKFPSLEYCSRRIEEGVSFFNDSGQPAFPSSVQSISDYHVLKTFSQLSCPQISALFSQTRPTDKEKNFLLAYILQLYKGAGLFVKQLQFIYMPQNIYCINIDKSSSTVFVSAVEQIVRCLPNVFVTEKRIKVIYLHVSTLQAQLNCMEDLLESSVPWRYLFNLCGQDFPLYPNKGIVQALQALNGRTNAESCEVKDDNTRLRTTNVFEVERVPGNEGHDRYKWANTGKIKSPPPYGIKIYKGSSFIAGTREFCEYAVHGEIAKAFLDWLNDTIFVDESFFSSLYRHPGVPGGVPEKQPEFITRGAVKWYHPEKESICYGRWLRGICVLSLADLSWLFKPDLQNMLFTQKIEFEYDAELVDCLYVMVQNRKHHPYGKGGISWNGPCADSEILTA